MIVLVLVTDAKELDGIQNQLCAIGAVECIMEMPITAAPSSLPGALNMAKKLRPNFEPYLTKNSKAYVKMYEVKSNELPKG